MNLTFGQLLGKMAQGNYYDRVPSCGNKTVWQIWLDCIAYFKEQGMNPFPKDYINIEICSCIPVTRPDGEQING